MTIHCILKKSKSTKKQMIAKTRNPITRNDLNKWVFDQLTDIEAVMLERENLKINEKLKGPDLLIG